MTLSSTRASFRAALEEIERYQPARGQFPAFLSAVDRPTGDQPREAAALPELPAEHDSKRRRYSNLLT